MTFTTVSLLVGSVMLLNLLVAMLSLLRQASPVDHILALQLVGSMGLGVMLVVGLALAVPGTLDLALVAALLAAVTTVAFTRGQPRPDAVNPANTPVEPPR